MTKSKPQIESQKIKFKATKPHEVKAVLKDWVTSSDKAQSDPYQLDKAPDWAANALAEVAKLYMPGGRLPTSGEWDLEMVGEYLGRLLAYTKLQAGEISMRPETKADYDLMAKLSAAQSQSSESVSTQNEIVMLSPAAVETISQAIPQLTEYALGSSHEDTLKLHKGLSKGLSLAPDELTMGKLFKRHTRTFLALGAQWQRFATCRSVAEVHRKLCDEFGEKRIGSLKTFEGRVAKKIGMKFGRSGRPPKSK